MKYFLPLFIFFITINLSSNELAWVDEQVKSIKPSREGISDIQISKLKDPFVSYKHSIKKRKTNNTRSTKHTQYKKKKTKTYKQIGGFKLNAVMNNSAFINGKWYKLNDKIGRYKISRVNKTSITLSKNDKKIILTLYNKNKNKNLKFQR